MISKAFRDSCVVLNTGDERAMGRRVTHRESCDIFYDYDRVQKDISVYMPYNREKINNIPLRYCKIFLITAHFSYVALLCPRHVH